AGVRPYARARRPRAHPARSRTCAAHGALPRRLVGPDPGRARRSPARAPPPRPLRLHAALLLRLCRLQRHRDRARRALRLRYRGELRQSPRPPQPGPALAALAHDAHGLASPPPLHPDEPCAPAPRLAGRARDRRRAARETMRRRALLGAGLLYAALAVVSQRALLPGLGDHVYYQGVPGNDCLLHAWTLAWDQHALATRPCRLLDANIFYPHARTL